MIDIPDNLTVGELLSLLKIRSKYLENTKDITFIRDINKWVISHEEDKIVISAPINIKPKRSTARR